MVGVAVAMGVAALVQSLSGFGFSLLAVPLMSLAVDVRLAVVVSTLVAMGTTATHAWKERSRAHAALARRLIAASFVGMPLGLLAFVRLSERHLKVGLGVTILVLTLMLVRGVVIDDSARAREWMLGLLSGALATSLSTNGPPLVFVLHARGLKPEEFRGTINRVFFVVNFVTLGLFLLAGRVTRDSLLLGGLVIPVVVVSTLVGYGLRRHVDERRFRGLVLFLLALSGASAIVTAV